MKIAYLINQYPKISHTFVRREIQALEELGVDVERVSVRRVEEPLADRADQLEQERTRVILDGGVKGLLAGLARAARKRPAGLLKAARRALDVGRRSDRGLLYHGAYLAEACVLAEWLEERNVEHVHAHFGTNSATVAMLCRDLGGPEFSFTVHGPEEFDKPDAIRLGTKIEAARFVAGVSSFGRSQLWRRVSARYWDKVHIVRCGLDDAFLAEPPRAVPDVARFVCVGRLHEQKGQMVLVEATAALARAGVRCEIVLVGDGELRAELEAALERHGLQEQVTITGWADGERVKKELLEARALVLPSFAEGLPVVIMEALALGRPVISTYVAGIPELVGAECGWLVPAGDVQALEVAMRECLGTDASKLTRMGAEGHRRVRAMHDIRSSAKRLVAILRGEDPERAVPQSLEVSPEARA